jgi:hypothetical protein
MATRGELVAVAIGVRVAGTDFDVTVCLVRAYPIECRDAGDWKYRDRGGGDACRLGVPARYVSAYAWRLEPPDFHGLEAFLRGPRGLGWYVFDPTGMADPASIVRIGIGRDAVEVAFCTQIRRDAP